ncbi:hypothetical protein HDU82_007840, partial [Entophlyctis luteolus]
AKDVDVQRVIWTTMLIAVVFFGVVGVFPALAFDGLAVTDASSPTVNVITLFTNPMVAAHPIVNKAFCYMFSIVMLLPAIPVSCLVSQENIEQNFRLSQYGGTGKWILRIVCYALPWIVSIPLLTGNGLATFMNWTGFAASKDKEPFLSQFNRRKPNLPEIGTGLKLIPDPTQMSPTAEGGQQSVRLNFDSFVRRLGFGSKQREDNEFHIPLPPLVSQNTQKYGTVGGEDNGESTISLSVESAETLQVSIPAIAISSENGAGAEPGDTTDIGTERGTPEEPTRQASDEFWLQEAVPDPLLERPETTVGGASLQRLLGNATLTMQRLTTPMRKRSFGTFPTHESPTVNNSSMDGDEHAVAIPSSKPGTLIVDEDFAHLSVVAHDDDGLLDLAGMPLTGSADTRRENSRLRHLGTLMPIHKDFVAKTAFCAVPYWIPVSGPVIAKVLLVVSVLLVVLVVVLQIVSAVQ